MKGKENELAILYSQLEKCKELWRENRNKWGETDMIKHVWLIVKILKEIKNIESGLDI
jgi:hypothetical protein